MLTWGLKNNSTKMIAHHKALKNYYLSSPMAMVKALLKDSKTTVIKTVSTEN